MVQTKTKHGQMTKESEKNVEEFLSVPSFITAKHLELCYGSGAGSFVAVSDLNLEVPKGQFCTLIGPSGCGKSTILKAIAGIVAPYSGELRVSLPAHRRARDISMAFQTPTLMPWLTVEQNALLPFKITGEMVTAEIYERLGLYLKMVGLSEYSSSLPRQLSGGMAMRAAIVRAFLTDAQLILMDEPFSALDEWTRDHLCMELESLWQLTGNTIVFVTHNLIEAVLLSDIIFLLSSNPGRIVGSFSVPFERPRRSSLRSDPLFIELIEDIRAGLSEVAQPLLSNGQKN